MCRKKTNTLLLYKQHVLCTVRNKPEKEKPATCRSAPREVGCAGWDQARCFCSGVDVQSRFITVLQQKPFRGHAPMEHPFFFWNVVTRQRCSSDCAGGAAWSSSSSPATAPSVPHTCAAANSSSSSGDKPAPPHWAHEDVSPVAGLYFESGAGTGTPESGDRLERGKGEETKRRAGLETQ